ncbi:MAG: AmmeMemoRadiSam system protein B [Chloroflexota bacterium]
MTEKINVRPSPIAGTWYSGNPNTLRSEVDRYIKEATEITIPGEIIAVIAPHAGHRYSGPVAGYSFAALKGLSPDLVAVISPMHSPYPAHLLTSSHDAYYTPLGTIPIDHDALKQIDAHLKKNSKLSLTYISNDPEHSLEIELPFIQCIFTHPYYLLPIMVRDQTANVTRALGNAIAETLREKNFILVASTDLSHMYPQPLAEKYDREILRRIELFDPEAVMRAESEGKGFACGLGAVIAVMYAAIALGADSVKILKYATSGDVTGDYSSVVGYGAAAIYRSIT